MQVELEGGDRLTGEVVEETDDTVVLQTRFGAVVRIPKDSILATTEVGEPGTDDATESDGEAETAESLDVSGELELGAALVSSVQDRHDYLGRLDLTFARGDDRLRLQGLVDVQRAANVDLRDRQQAGISFRKGLESSYFANLAARYQRDPTVGLRRRTSASLQLGRQVFDSDEHSLSVRAGPGYASERRVDGQTWVNPLVSWGVDYEHNLGGLLERFLIRHGQEASIDPRGRPLRLLLESETSLRYRITADLYLALTASIDVDSLSPDRARTLDRRLQLRLGFGW